MDKDLNKEIKKQEKEIKKLKQELEKIEKNNEKLENKTEKYMEEISKLKETISSKNNIIKELKEDKQKRIAEKKEKQAQVKQLSEEIKEKDEEIDSVPDYEFVWFDVKDNETLRECWNLSLIKENSYKWKPVYTKKQEEDGTISKKLKLRKKVNIVKKKDLMGTRELSTISLQDLCLNAVEDKSMYKEVIFLETNEILSSYKGREIIEQSYDQYRKLKGKKMIKDLKSLTFTAEQNQEKALSEKMITASEKLLTKEVEEFDFDKFIKENKIKLEPNVLYIKYIPAEKSAIYFCVR